MLPFYLISLLQNSLNETLAALPANAMAELGALIDPQWIEQALRASGKVSIHRCMLPVAACGVAGHWAGLVSPHADVAGGAGDGADP